VWASRAYDHYDAEGARTPAVCVSRSLAQRILSALTLSTLRNIPYGNNLNFQTISRRIRTSVSSIWGAVMQTLRHSSPGSSRRLGRIPETAELLASCAVIVGCLLGSVIIGASLYAAVVPVSHSSAKMQSTANGASVLKGDRVDRTAATRDWTTGPMKMKVVSPDQKLLIGCEPAFSKLAINRDRRAARCLT
jgi:hypothetical protein